MSTPVVYWHVPGRHYLTRYDVNQRTWDTRCGLTLPAADDDTDTTTRTPDIACGACLTSDARKHIEAARTKHAATTTKLARYT